VFDQRFGSCPGLRREADGQTVGEIMPAHAHHMVEKCKHGLLSGLVLFRLLPPLFSLEWGALYSTGCMVPQSFPTGANWPYPEFWAITGDRWYLGY
jgi:hypothetical protein